MNFIKLKTQRIIERMPENESKEYTIKSIMWSIADLIPEENRVKFVRDLADDIQAELSFKLN